MKYICGIYSITHIDSGRQYIGSSGDFKDRWRRHIASLRKNKHHSKFLQRVWNKYGEAKFEFKQLIICSQENLLYYEQMCIDNIKPIFNSAKVAGALVSKGQKLPPEWVANIRKAAVAFFAGDSESAQYLRSPEFRKKRSDIVKALWATPEYRKNASDSRKGNTFCLGHKCNPEQIENRKRAARISNMKRNYGVNWTSEYVRRYPEHSKDVEIYGQ